MPTPTAEVTRELPALSMRAAIRPGSIDEKKRTVEVIWTTGARVLRGFWDKFYEELSLDPSHVRMGRLNNGAPLLDSHRVGDLKAVLGVVESARLEKGQGVAVVRFAKAEDDPEADAVFRKVKDGIIQNISVGYRTFKMEKVEGGAAEIPVFRAIDWEPYELSAVTAGADDGAGFRAAASEAPPNQCVIVVPPKENRSMDPNHNTAPEVLAERKRVAFITSAGAKHARAGIDADFTRDLIERGVPLEACRAAVLERLAAYSDSLPPFSTPPAMERNMMLDADGHARELPPTRPAITPGNDAGEDFRRAAIDSIMLRTGIEVKKPHAAAGDVSSSVHDLARICLSRAGKSSSRIFGGEARGLDLIKRAMTTSDFPNILSGALHATIRRGYEEEPATHRAWVRVVPVPDFRDQERPILGSAPSLDVVLEHAEYTHGYLTDDKTSYRVEKFGKIVALSWEVLVNDNLSAFLRLQPVLGQAARRKEADLVYAILAANPVMQDGVALFHTATHGNMTSSAAFDATQLSAGRTLLRKQTALGGGYLALAPRYLIVPVEKETAAETLLANATRRATSEKVTPEWISNLQLVVEPRLASTAVYLASDPNQIDTVELGLLEENASGPIIEEEREFGKDIFSWKVRHVCGAKALDWRGLVKMPVT